MRQIVAYKFTSELSIAEMRQRLGALGVWTWYARDNDRWGDYLSASPIPDTQVKILVDPADEGYAVNFKFVCDHPDAERQFAELHGLLIGRVLPAIEATVTAEVDDFE